MTTETHNPAPRRRWYQFSLRTLLIVVTISAVPLGWFAWKVEQGRRHRAVIAWVEMMGGRVESGGGWAESWFGLDVAYVDLSNTQVGDLSPLAELENLEVLYLENTPVSDEQVRRLQKALPGCDIER